MSLLLYGATGYTGGLIARLSASSGVRPILAARNEAALAPLAASLAFEHRAFDLTDARRIEAALDGVSVVLHCAGPFSRTSAPMASACIARGAHYLDVTGEIAVFEALAARTDEAARAGVMLLPGAGFDVVATDCLAAHLKRRLPSATRLTLAIAGTGRLSRGTAITAIENAHRGGRVRRDGRLEHVPAAWRTRTIDFGRGPRTAVTIPWGDVVTAYHSTGIPNIEVYAAVSRVMRRFILASRHLGWLLRSRRLQRVIAWKIRAGQAGPSDAELESGASFVWGRVEDEDGRAAVARETGPDGYLFTARAALLIARRVLAGDAPPGYQTPATAYGEDLALEVAGVTREDMLDV